MIWLFVFFPKKSGVVFLGIRPSIFVSESHSFLSIPAPPPFLPGPGRFHSDPRWTELFVESPALVLQPEPCSAPPASTDRLWSPERKAANIKYSFNMKNKKHSFFANTNDNNTHFLYNINSTQTLRRENHDSVQSINYKVKMDDKWGSIIYWFL